MAKFYVVSGEHGAISNVYDLNDRIKLSTLFITRTETDEKLDKRVNGRLPPCFTVYNSRTRFLQTYETMSYEDKRLHELILDIPQKLRFDIDAARSSDNINDKIFRGNTKDFDSMIDNIIEKIQHKFWKLYGVELPRKNIIVCDSSGPNKFSRHIIINGYSVNGHKQAEYFALQVIDDLPPNQAVFIDRSVYKNKQFFRIVGSHKAGSDRIKTIMPYEENGVTESYKLEDTFITNTLSCTKLKPIEIVEDMVNANIREIQLEGSDINEISRLVQEAGLDEYYSYSKRDGNIIAYNRKKPSVCEICMREHTSNGMFVLVLKNGDLAEVFQCCFMWNKEHPNDKRRISLGTFITECPDNLPNVTPDVKTMSVLEKSINQSFTEDKLPMLWLPQVNIYDEPALRPFELAKTLFVHAGMKMGKTRALKQFMDTNFKNCDTVKYRIMFMSFRQTFSNNIKSSFPEFELYSSVRGDLNKYDKLIVQIESLHRLNIDQSTPYADLLILDESESIFEQLSSGLTKKFAASYAAFEWLLRTSHHVIAMDANMTSRTYNVIDTIRGVDDAIYHRNTYKNASSDQYYLTTNYAKWIGCLRIAISGDEKVAIVVNSIKEAKELHLHLTRMYSKKLIQLYSSETSMADKKRDFSNVNNTWNGLDVLIYTPTVSAGVSFEQKHFNKVFAYFTDYSCNAEICVQMLGRVRDVSSKLYFTCLKLKGNNLSENTDDILDELTNNRDKLFEGINTDNLPIYYTKSGKRAYHQSTYLTVWLENVRVTRISRNNFSKRFIYLLRSVGANVSLLDDDVFTEHTGMPYLGEDGKIDQELMEWLDQRMVDGNDLIVIESKAVSDAPDISDEEYDRIKSKMTAQEDLTDFEQLAYTKARIRHLYDYYQPITHEFVSLYGNEATIRKFKNLQAINGDKPVHEQIQDIKNYEASESKRLLSGDVSEQQIELNYKYSGNKHQYAHELVTAMGFESVRDSKYVPKVVLDEGVVQRVRELPEYIRKICNEFEIKMPAASRLSLIDGKLQHVVFNITKQVLSYMYGIKLTIVGDMLMLLPNTMFANDNKVYPDKPTL